MKRNMDLIRDLLLYVEGLPAGAAFRPVNLELGEYDTREVCDHLKLLLDAEYLEGQLERQGGEVKGRINGMTMKGHDLIASIRNDTVWNQTKEKVSDVGGSVALATIQALAISIMNKMLGL